ncbi:hypothetical protein AGRA3207_004340 [Actinomadura graeca]|uniref:Rpn family recombination-promoting nuclease/putative transposase n=1 Tax=Actinomadura graeca TaxID=2750812 RepID=A0ABX8QWJ5_9ACTN|nr:hypothetical protein [Actinomadura graeca]QXJ23211.1 hypothetical protein AGRA3207_004340 [Actinomadura graeca]
MLVPTNMHELPLEMVRNRPELVPALLRTVFSLEVPSPDRITLTSESYADTHPAELRCDATVLLGEPEAPDLGVVVESQLRAREEKRYSWPAYLAALRLRRRCPVVLLVLCPDRATARGCAVPIDMGHPGWVLTPLTVSPEVLPPITDPNEARRLPELAVLSAPAHADGPHAEAVLHSVAAAIETLSDNVGDLYHDYILPQLSEAAQKLLEETVEKNEYTWVSKFAVNHRSAGREEGRREGRAEGEADMLLFVLETRGISVSDQVRDQIRACSDLDQLQRWAKCALTADSAEDFTSNVLQHNTV